MSAEKGLEEPLYREVDIELRNGNGMFSSGEAYTIYLTVNSLSEIIPKIEAGKWAEGGEAELNPDGEYKD